MRTPQQRARPSGWHAQLPTLVLGRDQAPRSCAACGSAFLSSEPPLGWHVRGRVGCETCGRTLAWLAPGPRSSFPVSRPAVPPPLPLSPSPVVRSILVVRRIAVGRWERTETCGPSCTAAYGHDPITHEHAGRDAVLAEFAGRRTGQVRTGGLVVDYGQRRALVTGSVVPLTPYEQGIVEYLASRLDLFCRHAEIAAAVWGATATDLWTARSNPWHALRVAISRVRAKLGPEAALLENRSGIGYRLRAVEPS